MRERTLVRWWVRLYSHRAAIVHRDLLDSLGLLRARLAIVQHAAEDALAHVAALQMLIGAASEGLRLEQLALSDLKQQASGLALTLTALQAEVDGVAAPSARTLRGALDQERRCTRQLSEIEGALGPRHALLAQSWATLVRATRAAAPLAAA